MGYYVSGHVASDPIVIPDPIAVRLHILNRLDERNGLITGSESLDRSLRDGFAQFHGLAPALQAFGFGDAALLRGAVQFSSYQGKHGLDEYILKLVAPFVREGDTPTMVFHAEDGDFWKVELVNGHAVRYDGIFQFHPTGRRL